MRDDVAADVHGDGQLMRLLALILGCALALTAAAGSVTLSYSPGATTVRSGCVAAGQYERAPTSVNGARGGQVTIANLPDAGRCYFVQDGGDELYFDFSALAGGPSLPGPVSNFAVTWSPTPPAPPLVQFSSNDLGAVGVAGSYSFSTAGVYTLRGAGADIWNSADAFRYACTQIQGDGSITARVVSLTNTDPWAKAGVMLRATAVSTDTGAPYGFTLLTPANGADFQSRGTAGATAGLSNTSDRVTTAPYWVRVSSVNNIVTGSLSRDGVTWTVKSFSSVVLGATPQACLAVTSHSSAALATAVFDNVTVLP